MRMLCTMVVSCMRPCSAFLRRRPDPSRLALRSVLRASGCRLEGDGTINSRARMAVMVLVLVLFSGTVFSQAVAEGDPLLRLDPTRYGAGELVAALEKLERYRLESNPPARVYNLVVPLLSHADPLVARTATWLLRRMGLGADAVSAAATVLANAASSEAQRISAAIALGELRTVGSAAPLLSALTNDAASEVRAAAAQALGALHREGSASALGTALTADADPRVRQAAAEALGSVPDSSLSLLLAALGDADAFVRVQVVWAIGRQRFVSAVGNLLRVLQDDADCRVQSAAAWAIYRLGDTSTCDALSSATQGSCRSTAQAAYWARSAMGCL
jgi:HEAT repeat protein